MIAACLTCGTVGPVEAHHVAGRENFPDLVVPVCVGCHLILTNWQNVSGTELAIDSERTELDRCRALIVGMLHVLQLMAQRSGEGDRAWLGAELMDLMARACSKVLDQAADPDRPGRWVPDPAFVFQTAQPVLADPATENERARELLGLVVYASNVLGGLPLVTQRRLREVAVRPDDFVNAFGVIARDHAATSRLAFAIGDFADLADQLVRLILMLPDNEALDEEFVRIGGECLKAGWAMLTLTLDLADEVAAAIERGEPW